MLRIFKGISGKLGKLELFIGLSKILEKTIEGFTLLHSFV